jgi:O-antigen/teichoic acid export membrane protein
MLGAGTAMGQLAVLLMTPIWSRLYEPAEFGRMGLMLSFLSVTSVATALRYDLAIPLGRGQNEAAQLLLTCLVLAVPTAILGGLGLWILIWTGSLGFDELPAWSALLLIPLLAMTGVFSAYRFWHVRQSNFSDISAALIAQGLGRALLPVLLAPLQLGWVGLAAGELGGRALGLRRLAQPVMAVLVATYRAASSTDIRSTLRRFNRYPLVFLPSSILDAVGGAMAVPLFVHYFGVATGGHFLLAQQIVIIPSALLCAALADVYHSRLVEIAPEALLKAVGGEAVRLLLIAAALYVPLAILGPWLAVPVFGSSWEATGDLVAALAFSAIPGVIVSPLSRGLVLSRIPEIKLVADTVKIVVPALGIVAGSTLNLSASDTTVIFAVLTAVSYGVYFCVLLYALQPRNQIARDRLDASDAPV